MTRVLAALCLLALPALPALAAAQTIRGTVVDDQSSAPIAGATIATADSVVRATTDASGHFTLTSTAAITRIIVWAPGYAPRTVDVTQPGEPLTIRLDLSQTQLPGIQVAARRPTLSVGVLSKEDLDRSSGLRLESAINTLPGVFMQSRTPWGGARITLRGYYPSTSGNSPNANGLGYQVFLDDIPITDAAGATVLDDVDFASLGGVEVIKGPASSLYGSFIGGAVNLTTASAVPNETSFGQQVVSGSDGLVRTNTTFQGAGAHGDIVLNYGHQTYDSFRPHSGSGKDYIRGSGDLAVSTRQTVSAYFSYNRSFEELAGEIDSTDFYARQPVSNAAYLANDSHIKVTSFILGLTNRYTLSDELTNQTTVFGVGRTSNQPFAHGFTDVNQFNFGARSAFTYSAPLGATGTVTGTLGASIQRSNLTTNGVFIVPAPPFPERPTDQQNHATATSLFTEWSFALPRGLTVTAGTSLNRNQFTIHNLLVDNQVADSTVEQTRQFDWAFTPRIAVTKELAGDALVYASVSAGYTPPLLSNTVASDGTVDLTLKPERAVQYEVGAHGSVLRDRLSGQLALFDIENTDKLVTETANSVTFTTNAGKQRNRGVEASLSWLAVDGRTSDAALSTVRPWVSYTYTDATFVDFRSDNNANANTVDYSGNAVPRVPRNMMSGGLDVAARNGLSLSATWQYVGRVPVTFDNSTYVRSYNLLGLRVGYSRQVAAHWKLDAFAGGDNLTGDTHYSFLFVGPNYAALAQPADGGRGDGYIIPAAYHATGYGSIGLTYVF